MFMYEKFLFFVKIIIFDTIVSIQENQAVLERLANNGRVKLLECLASWWKTLEWTLLSEMNLLMTTCRIIERRDLYG